MIILWIILWIIAIAFVIGVIAVVADIIAGIGKKSNHKPYGPYERFIKRGLDAFLATGAIIVLSPILLITAILVRVKLGSPVLFSQKRPGKDEKIFNLHKFRTMTDTKDENGNLLPDEVRLTSFGKKLRSTSLDELPELLNIIKGDMAVVGPRPLLVKYLPYYTEEQRHRHDVRPGLTGYAQAHGRNALNWDDKFAMDVEYTKRITFLGDAKIILDTVKAVFKHEGISSETSATMEDFTDYCDSIGRKSRV
jgi:undecaprenyl phosphate N,N'-diacetylbacillosamine 1-phosphate transferase